MSMGPAWKLATYAAILVVAFAAAWSLGAALNGPSGDHQAAAIGTPLAPPPTVVSGPQSSPETTTTVPVTPGRRTIASPGGERVANIPSATAGSPEAVTSDRPQPPSEPATPTQNTPAPPEPSPDDPTTSPSQPSVGCEPGGLLGPVICAVLGLAG
jgi:hypothetical protein